MPVAEIQPRARGPGRSFGADQASRGGNIVTETVWQRLDQGVRSLVPFALTLAMVLLGAVPWRVSGGAAITPWLALMAVYYWSIYRPDRLPYVAVFAIGILQDALGGTPLGLSAIVLVLIRALVVSQRRFFRGKSFVVVWAVFAAVALVATIVSWVLMLIYTWTALSPWPAWFQWGATVTAYPLLTWVFGWVHDLTLRQR